MPLYKCEWPNGDVSFVLAADVQDAIVRLDEFGAAEPKMLRPLSDFLIDLRPNRKLLEANERARRHNDNANANANDNDNANEEPGWPWELHEIGECLLDPESGVLPSEAKTLRRLRQFDSDARSQKREETLRARAIRDGTLVDLAEKRRARARQPLKRTAPKPADPAPVDEP